MTWTFGIMNDIILFCCYSSIYLVQLDNNHIVVHLHIPGPGYKLLQLVAFFNIKVAAMGEF